MSAIPKLIFYGEETLSPDGSLVYNIATAKRDVTNRHEINLDKNDKILDLTFDDGTTWMCDASTLHEVFPQADPVVSRAMNRGGDIEIPVYLEADEQQRGIIGKIALKTLKLFAKKTVSNKIGDIARRLEDKNLLNGIGENHAMWMNNSLTVFKDEGAGLFRIDEKFNFSKFDGGNAGKPYFLFIHGTNSDTYGAFASLMNSEAWKTLHKNYAGNVIAFQHRTLTESPLENVVKLSNLLPDKSTVHILSHSRGGLVGDILSMYSSANGTKPLGFSNLNKALLDKEGRERDNECIDELRSIFSTKQINVEKFIRVACPAAGTQLASNRIDNILNTFFNLFGGDVNPVADILKELLTAVISTKHNVDALPGLEAMNPESPFIKVLNDLSTDRQLDNGQFSVISGNGTFSFSAKGLLVILGRLFYNQRNDLVVNTDSMYLGARRRTIQYYFDQGAEVNHVKYFLNHYTCNAIEAALKAPSGASIPGFKDSSQDAIPATDRGILGIEGGELPPFPQPVTGKKPILVLIPGIMGSNLHLKSDKLWLNYINLLSGGISKLLPINKKDIAAHSLIKSSYGKLANYLSVKYDVVIYPFDWRKQLNDCAAELNTKLEELMKFNQPIKLIGHSMGGVLIRDFIVNHESTWTRLNRSPGFRVLYLGSPLGGSHRILTVMFGQDAIIRMLNKADLMHSKKELVEMFVQFPGILSLLPLTTDDGNDFAKLSTWQNMRNGYFDNNWPLPSQEDLTAFGNYRDAILKKANSIDYSNMVYIAGKDKQTPAGYTFDPYSTKPELLFLSTSEGDQSVTWASGIPKQIEDAKNVYYVDVSHGDLANEPDIFDAIDEILQQGSTDQLSKIKITRRGEELLFRTNEEYDFDYSQDGIVRGILGNKPKKSSREEVQRPVTVTLTNGDLRYSKYPVMAGHFTDDGILAAEKVIDECLNDILTVKRELRIYPGEIGTSEVFGSHGTFNGAIIIGLGKPETLTPFLLSKSVEQAVANYLLSLKVDNEESVSVGISSLLIGRGYELISMEGCLKAIIGGVVNANQSVNSFLKKERKVTEIEFIEIYQDRALNCMYTLKQLESQRNQEFSFKLKSTKYRKTFGSRKRIPFDATADWWHRITVKCNKNENEEPEGMVFGVQTSSAREEESKIVHNTTLIAPFINEVSIEEQWDPHIAKTLFELMMPNDLKEKIKQRGNINWVLDKYCASYPWELLQPGTSNSKPLCIDVGMIRQLSTGDFRRGYKVAAREKALIIADPNLQSPKEQLAGAVEEGRSVNDVFTKNGLNPVTLINRNAGEILRNLFSDDYTILHLAAHGVYDPEAPEKSGMRIGKDIYLTVFQFEQLTVVPELVFVNCCHIGKIAEADEKFYRDRFKLAANIGTQLIEMGVKAVVAAGWAVNDRAAKEFAEVFYASMFAGDNFGDAITKARSQIYRNYPETNTWGAYQCYGDPYYKFRQSNAQYKEWRPSYTVPEEAEIHLDNLLTSIETGKRSKEYNVKELETIVEEAIKADVIRPSITERIAMIYMELGMFKEAIAQYKSLLTQENAGFSFASLEQYCNVQTKECIQDYFSAEKPGSPETALRTINNVIEDLNILRNTGMTAERLNLLGSAFKRKSMLVDTKAERLKAYQHAAYYYRKAASLKTNSGIIYPFCNVVLLEYLIRHLDSTIDSYTVAGENLKMMKPEIIEERLADIIKHQEKDNTEYWDLVDEANIKLCQLMLRVQTATDLEWEELNKEYKKVWDKAGSESKRISELEHLQFLSYSLANTKDEPDVKVFPRYNIAGKIDGEVLKAQLNNLMKIAMASQPKNSNGMKNTGSSNGKKPGSKPKVAGKKKTIRSKTTRPVK